MSRPEIHIAQIKQEIAMMVHDGYVVDFEEQVCIQSIEYNLTKYLRHRDKKEKRQT